MSKAKELILLAEDDDDLRYLCMRQLKKLGFVAHYARDGEEAVNMVAQFPYSMILMDVMMPKMDGCDATRAIREVDHKLGRPRTPIVAMTAQTDKDLCLHAGMDDFLFKPVLLDDLRQKLRIYFGDGNNSEDNGRQNNSTA